MSFKRWPANKHSSRMRLYQLERFSTVDPQGKIDCLMLEGHCECVFMSQCKHIEEVESPRGGTGRRKGLKIPQS